MATRACPASSEMGKATWRGGASSGRVKATCAWSLLSAVCTSTSLGKPTAWPSSGRRGRDIWGWTQASLGELMGWPCWGLQARAQLPQGLLSEHCDSKLRGWSGELCLASQQSPNKNGHSHGRLACRSSSCLETPTGREALWATVQADMTKRLTCFHFHCQEASPCLGLPGWPILPKGVQTCTDVHRYA